MKRHANPVVLFFRGSLCEMSRREFDGLAIIRSIEGGRAFNAGNRASIGLVLPPYGFSFFSITR